MISTVSPWSIVVMTLWLVLGPLRRLSRSTSIVAVVEALGASRTAAQGEIQCRRPAHGDAVRDLIPAIGGAADDRRRLTPGHHLQRTVTGCASITEIEPVSVDGGRAGARGRTAAVAREREIRASAQPVSDVCCT